MFRVYKADIVVNETRFKEVWIDPHYEENHSESITDELILNLIDLLDGQNFHAQKVSDKGFQFFVSDLVFESKPYRMVWLISPERDYLGVRTAFRRSK